MGHRIIGQLWLILMDMGHRLMTYIAQLIPKIIWNMYRSQHHSNRKKKTKIQKKYLEQIKLHIMTIFFNYGVALPVCFIRKCTGALDSIRCTDYPKPFFLNVIGPRGFGSDASHVKCLLYGNINPLNLKCLKWKTVIMKS
jgi:hypothetical protein